MGETIPVLQEDGSVREENLDESPALKVVQGILADTSPRLSDKRVPSPDGKIMLQPLRPTGLPKPDQEK